MRIAEDTVNRMVKRQPNLTLAQARALMRLLEVRLMIGDPDPKMLGIVKLYKSIDDALAVFGVTE